MIALATEAEVWTEADDKEIEYGKWNRYTAKTARTEEYKVHPPQGALWPHWSEGVPTTLRQRLHYPSFNQNGVHHKAVEALTSLDLHWNEMRLLSQLQGDNRLLPSAHHTSEWRGIYRVFSLGASIDRCCGKDPTGTLYLGRAGSGGRDWSILHTRINDLAYRAHHAMGNWTYNDLVKQKYPWESLAVEWAFTARERVDLKGEGFDEAKRAERWLLRCYCESYGELPPWNQKI